MKDVSSLINTMQEMGNPFSEDSQNLIALDSEQIMPKEVIRLCQRSQNDWSRPV